RFPAHGLPVVSRFAALRSLRVLDGPAQAVEPVAFDEEIVRPSSSLARALVATLPLHEEALEPPSHVAVDLLELVRRVAGAEVVAPAAQHRVQAADQHPHVLHPVPAPSGQLLHALPHPLHAAQRGPSLEEVHALPRPHPDRPAHALAEVAAEEVEALPTPG